MQFNLLQPSNTNMAQKYLVRDLSSSEAHYSRLYPLVPTQAYDTYWLFACERQNIFYNKLARMVGATTCDPVLATYKFTNAYRAADRVSQYLIRNVIYSGPQDAINLFFRTLLFKVFNKISTWKLLEKKFETICYEDFSFKHYDKLLSDAMSSGETIYSAAYIMPSGSSKFGHQRKHTNHLELLRLMIKDSVPAKIQDANKLQDVFEILCSYHSIGNFLAYQFAIDLNYSNLIDFSENEFVVPGPGALNGIAKCFKSLGGMTECEAIRFMLDRQSLEFERLGLTFKNLWGRQLHLIDCQNLFCEVDKYCRVALPSLNGLNARKQIKQKYSKQLDPIKFWFPPKWGLNEKIK